jgi:hypothetical protein
MGLTAKLPNRFDYLSHTATISWVVVAQATTVGVERQFADA